MFATMRRKRRSAMMKQELGQSMDHFKRAATLAAEGTSATVGPRFSAAKGMVQPVAERAKGTASSGWESAVATLTPLVAAASENVRLTGRKPVKVSRRTAKKNKKDAERLEKRANRALRRQKSSRRTGRLFGLALVGGAVGAAAAYMMKRRQAQQWDEYDPNRPISQIKQAGGADDAAFEPTDDTVTPADDTVTPIGTTTAGTTAGGTTAGGTTPAKSTSANTTKD